MDTQENCLDLLVQIASSFRISTVMFTAIELDLFSLIPEEGATLAEIVNSLETKEKPLDLLLNTLVALGFLEKQNQQFFVPVEIAPFLQKNSPLYFGNRLLLHKQENENWLKMGELFSSDYQGDTFYEKLLKSSQVKDYFRTVEKHNRPYADQIIFYLQDNFPQVNRILDIGGGHGYYAEKFLEVNQEATVTILDVEKSIEYAKKRQQNNPNYQRLEFQVGDARKENYENEFELVMVNDLLHYFPWDEKLEILEKAVKALKTEGVLAVSKFRLDEQGIKPAESTIFSLRMYMNTMKGYLEKDEETVELFQKLNLENVEIIPLGERKTLLIGRKK